MQLLALIGAIIYYIFNALPGLVQGGKLCYIIALINKNIEELKNLAFTFIGIFIGILIFSQTK